jgi:hypothetical protein
LDNGQARAKGYAIKVTVIGRGTVGGGLAKRWRDALLFAANQAGLGPFFYRFAKPGDL